MSRMEDWDLPDPKPVVESPMADRLKRARLAVGFSTASDAAQKLGFNVSTYLSHENGSRGMPITTITEYARAFSASPAWLAFGDGDLPLSAPLRVDYVKPVPLNVSIADDTVSMPLDQFTALLKRIK